NSAITMNMAIDGESPYDNADLWNYLQRHMSIMRTSTRLPWNASFKAWDGTFFSSARNGAFYTTDGMRFEFDDARVLGQTSSNLLKLHESNENACFATIFNNDNKGEDWPNDD